MVSTLIIYLKVTFITFILILVNFSDFQFFINIKLYQIKGQPGQRSPEDHLIIVASLSTIMVD